MSLRTPLPAGASQNWMRSGALLGIGLLALACASKGPREADLQPLALATRANPGVHAVKTWSAEFAPEFDFMQECLPRFLALHPGQLQFRRNGGAELEFETDAAGFEALADFQVIFCFDTSEPAAVDLSQLDPAGWLRRAALGIPQQPARRISLAVLAPAAEQEQASRVLRAAQAEIDAVHAGLTPTEGTQAAVGSAAILVESSASKPSEVRWIPPSESRPGVSPHERAQWSLRAARLAAEVPGWSLVPAGVDLLGRIEPAYLYTSGDVPNAQQRLDALHAALQRDSRAPMDRVALARELALRDERLRFARAQLSSELFQLRALHTRSLGAFEQVAHELEALSLADLAALDPGQGRWSVVGPPEAWSAHLAELGAVTIVRPPPSALDPHVAAELDRMWTALGGVRPWRELRALRLQSQLDVEGAERSQGIEQWIDFAGDRFVLAQAVGTLETMVVVTAAQAWAIGEKDTPDLASEQARRLRYRQERTLFALLRRLAQPACGGLQVRREAERLVVSDAGNRLCWLELAADGLPRRSGYAMEGETAESLYQYEDWNLDAPLPYPARTQQIDRKAVSTLRTVAPGAAPDPQIWEHNKN